MTQRALRAWRGDVTGPRERRDEEENEHGETKREHMSALNSVWKDGTERVTFPCWV